MKGTNELHLNAATMIEALQLWAEANFKNAPRILGVKETKENYQAQTFVVTCDDYKETA